MKRRISRKTARQEFNKKLILNQWLISLFGISQPKKYEYKIDEVSPFHQLAKPIQDRKLEGLNSDNLHHFYHELVHSHLFQNAKCVLSINQIQSYEENISSHTQAINKKRSRPIVWKYFQWLTLLFVEIYLDRFFENREKLLGELNKFLDRFNLEWEEFPNIDSYIDDDLNKLCLQNATGSGKTLLMHVNFLQFRYYASMHGRTKDITRVILLTPNERLSTQHIAELVESGISSERYIQSRNGLWGAANPLAHVDVLEITKLVNQEKINTIATRSLGDQNLLLVDEGHRGMSSGYDGTWLTRRSELCAKGFTFEYSATIQEAVAANKDLKFENSYAKNIIFDYSYRWFYNDGFGKDYQILNLSKYIDQNLLLDQSLLIYMTACMLKFYQQLCIYNDLHKEFKSFNLEKPLWVFVGSTVTAVKSEKNIPIMATDVGRIILFIADFLKNQDDAKQRIGMILGVSAQTTGLQDDEGNDIFDGTFSYLATGMSKGKTPGDVYQDILGELFNNKAGGQLNLGRIKGASGEIALSVGMSNDHFGLINVGDAKSLCNHLAAVANQAEFLVSVQDCNFSNSIFDSVKESISPVKLLIGSKKFVEGWDCWRVSTMGLMHVGQSEGAQIIQLFGRGIRLKGYEWCLKRSACSHAQNAPAYINELETLYVFGIKADFMESFRKFLEREGLPSNDRREIIKIPLNLTHDFDRDLKTLQPKRRDSNDGEYDFKKHARIPTLGTVPKYMMDNKVIADWYPDIQTIQSRQTAKNSAQKDDVCLQEHNLELLDYDELFFELERFKRERGWYNLNINKKGIKELLNNPGWYTLYLPSIHLNPTNFKGVILLQKIAAGLLKRYCDRFYNFSKREFIEPRLELRKLTREDNNIPQETEYQISVDPRDEGVIHGVLRIKDILVQGKSGPPPMSDLRFCNFDRHLFKPLFHIKGSAKISVQPVDLNDSEFRFISDLEKWYNGRSAIEKKDGMELFLLRNMSKGKGIGFFEAGNFHPDFILWMLLDGKQYINFVEPHGLRYEGPGSEKILFYKQIKKIEKRLNDPDVILNSFIISPTEHTQVKWEMTLNEFEDKHILFMKSDNKEYIAKLFRRLRKYAKNA